MSYVLFHGAKKNVGDYLIRQRARALLNRYTNIGSEDLVEFEMVRQDITKTQLNQIAKAEAVVIAGGPAYQERFNEVYPSLPAVLDEGVPVFPLGPGWKGVDEETYSLTESSVSLLRRIHERIPFSGVRDLPTKRVLNKHGISNVKLVGCPAWYDLDSLNKPFSKPESIDSLVISTAVPRSHYYRKQFRYLLKRVADVYPDVDRICSFHRGIYSDDHTSLLDSLHLRRFRRVASKNGYEILNPAYQPEQLQRYQDIDLHLGYRVHGHIYFLASRKPSFLLQVDGRGTGVSESIRSPGDVRAFDRNSYREPVDEVLSEISAAVDNGFEEFDVTGERIDDVHREMRELVETIA